MRNADTRYFYELLDELEHRLGGPRRLRECTADSGWPLNGVYFFFEEGEHRRAGQGRRVVRVGTHAIKKTTPSRESLWNRLEDHRGRQNDEVGPRHSHSIFRKHIGGAIIIRDKMGGPEVLDNWYHFRRQPLADSIELKVSLHIGVMLFLWLDVPKREKREQIEIGAIALLSLLTGDADPPSPGWLGLHARPLQIRQSGLWNVHHTSRSYNARFLDLMRTQVLEVCATPPGTMSRDTKATSGHLVQQPSAAARTHPSDRTRPL